MTDTNTLVVAVMSALALLVSVIALRRSKKGPRTGSDEPITMSGGSLHILTKREWTTASETNLYSECLNVCKGVLFYVDGDADAKPHENPNETGFTITFEYERSGGHNTDPKSKWKQHNLQLIFTAKTNSALARISYQIDTDTSAATMYSAKILKVLLDGGAHPHTHGKLNRISSTGLTPEMNYTAPGNSGLDEFILITKH